MYNHSLIQSPSLLLRVFVYLIKPGSLQPGFISLYSKKFTLNKKAGTATSLQPQLSYKFIAPFGTTQTSLKWTIIFFYSLAFSLVQ